MKKAAYSKKIAMAALCVLFAGVSAALVAGPVPQRDDPAKRVVPVKTDPKKGDPRRDEPKKVEPNRADPKRKPAGFAHVYGRIQVVSVAPDYRVQVVPAGEDLRVKVVNAFPNSPGEWQFVNAAPDFRIQFVNAAPDFRIRYVSVAPGPAL